MKKCNGCPILPRSEEAEQILNYGCLTDWPEAKKWYLETGKTWACHSNPTKPCVGLLIRLKKENIPIKVNELITESMTLEDIYRDI